MQYPPTRRDGFFLTCADGAEHFVTEGDVLAGRTCGTFRTVCGCQRVPAPSTDEFGTPCRSCHRVLASQGTPLPEQRPHHRHRTPGLLGRVLHLAGSK